MSDISPEALSIASKNAKLLSADGMLDRRAKLASLAEVSRRESHIVAEANAARLHAWIDQGSFALRQVDVFRGDATNANEIQSHFPADPSIDLGFADTPYELRSKWQTEEIGSATPEMEVLSTFAKLSVPVVILATRKGLKLTNPRYRRHAKLQNGHRALWIFELAE
jgi:hypothetical protein